MIKRVATRASKAVTIATSYALAYDVTGRTNGWRAGRRTGGAGATDPDDRDTPNARSAAAEVAGCSPE